MAFFVGMFVCIIIEAMATPLSELLTSATNDGIVWFGIILVYVLAMVIIPLGYIIVGLREQESNQSMFGIASGVLYFILAIMLTIFGWFWITAFSELITDGTLLVVFWVGLSSTWITAVLIAPAMKIISASKTL